MTPRTPDVVERFESCALGPGAFGHREHLLVAWTYLRDAPFEDAAQRFARNLKRFASHHGAARKYHATITWAFLALLAEAMDESPSLDFDALVAMHPNLLDARAQLAALYDRETLESERARRIPLLPARRSEL
jgi:hypothetical protein